jgi:hypothetical protein
VAGANIAAADNPPTRTAPATIFVLDLLNSRFEEFASIRNVVHKYLAGQPERMNFPTEILIGTGGAYAGSEAAFSPAG